MLTDLKRALDSSGHNDQENDLRRAARELLAQQFLFAENRRQRASYGVVTRHYAYFDKLFDALGWNLQRDDRFGYVGVVPLAEESHRLLKLDETLILLIARLLYEEAAEACQIEARTAFVDSEAVPEQRVARMQRSTFQGFSGHGYHPRITAFGLHPGYGSSVIPGLCSTRDNR